MEEQKVLTNEETKKVSGGADWEKKTITCPKCGSTYPIGTTHACRSKLPV